MQRRDQYPGGETGGFRRVVVLHLAAVVEAAVLLQEHGDQVGRRLEKGLRRVGAQGLERGQPLGRRAVLVEFPLFRFRRLANPLLRPGRADHDEVPRLQVGPARRRARRFQGRFDDVAGHGPGGELAHGPAPRQVRVEALDARTHFLDGILAIVRQRHRLVISHRTRSSAPSTRRRRLRRSPCPASRYRPRAPIPAGRSRAGASRAVPGR